MEENNDIIPDENINIVSPKKCSFLLNNLNMFIKSERKKYNFNIDLIKKDSNLNAFYKNKEKYSDDSEDLETIINDPSILTSHIIDTNNLNEKKNNYKKKKNTIPFSLNKRVKNNNNIYKSRDKSLNKKKKIININKNIPNSENSKNKDRKKLKKRKINIKIENNENNLTQSPKIKNKTIIFKDEDYTLKDSYYNELKNINTNTSNNKDKNLILESNSLKNSIQNNRNDMQEIITKKISIKPEILSGKKNLEGKNNKILMTDKEHNSNINNSYIKHYNNDKKFIKGNSLNSKKKYNMKLDTNDKFFKNKDIYKKNKNTNSICITNNQLNLIEKNNSYKTKIFHIDFSKNKKKELTKLIIGLNIIKGILFSKLKDFFLKLKQFLIYKKKVIYKIFSSNKKQPNTNIIKEDKNNNSIKNIVKKNKNNYIYNSNKKQNENMIKNYTYFKKIKKENNSDDDELKKINEKKTLSLNNKNDISNFMLLNSNNYINNYKINTIQINLFNNKRINKPQNNKTEIITKK